jgi:AmmeMemoRadiSam system protein A
MTDDLTPPVPDPRRAAAQIPEVDRRALLRLARRSIADFLERGTYPDIPTGSGALLMPRAVFVTLRHRQTRALRGCVGQVTAKGPLAQAVMHMAVAAATQDPRFPSVSDEELQQLRIEISALTDMEPITVDRIEVGRHGLLLRWRGRSGLLLPGVAVDHGWSHNDLLSGLCRKAGVPDGSWLDSDAELLGFETESWEETE